MTDSMPLKTSLPYRPDIDGLRAVAVLMVAAFHYFGFTFAGGFIGVDIFFVISGYLICGIILTDLENGNFTFRHFYARRILRIFPALIVVLSGCLFAGWLLLMPDELKRLGGYIASGAAFAENFLLMGDTGYFAPAAHEKPLLNLWSLGIEEQFYIFFPLLMWLCWKKHFSMLSAFALLAAFSFWYNLEFMHTAPLLDFYSPVTRIWELLAGALLQAASRTLWFRHAAARLDDLLRILMRKGGKGCAQGRIPGLMLAACGIILVIVGYCAAKPGIPYPGTCALWPVAGTLCLLAANPGNAISKFLFCPKPVVFLGKISYPLYLWHWPVLSFAWIIHGPLDEKTRMLRLCLLAISFGLAVMTWFFIERPIRFQRILGKAAIPLLCAALAATFAGGFICLANTGFPHRERIARGSWQPDALHTLPLTSERFSLNNLAYSVKNIFAMHTGGPAWPDAYAADEAGLKYTRTTLRQLQYCAFTDAGASRTVAIVGDSHGNLYGAVAALGRKAGFNTLLLGRFQPCLSGATAGQDNIILGVLADHPDIAKVIIVCRGIINITGIHNPGERADPAPFKGIGIQAYSKGLEEFTEKIKAMGKDIAILAETPELNIDPKDALERTLSGVNYKKNFTPTTREETLKRQEPYLEMLADISARTGAAVLYTIDAFCPGEECLVFGKDGSALYLDDDHLSPAGNELLLEKVVRPWLLEKPSKAP